MLTAILLFIGLALPIVSSVVYMVSIVQGRSRPHRMTRILLTVITALSGGALWASNDRAAVWLAFVSFVQSAVILALSLGRRGIGGREPFDFLCLGLCGGGIVLWLLSGESLFGLVMSIVADILACLPSLRKTIRWPHTESLTFYVLDVIAGAAIALAGAFTLGGLLYPLYIVAANAAFVLAIAWPRRSQSAAQSKQEETGLR